MILLLKTKELQNSEPKQNSRKKLSLIEKLEEDLKKRKAEARQLVKAKEEKELAILAKKIFREYKTTDFEKLREKMMHEFDLELETRYKKELEDMEKPVEGYNRLISQDDFIFLVRTAHRVEYDKQLNSEEVLQEIRRRFKS